jgi:hypothetical protein
MNLNVRLLGRPARVSSTIIFTYVSPSRSTTSTQASAASAYLSVIAALKVTSSQVNADANDENANNGKATTETIILFICFFSLDYF